MEVFLIRNLFLFCMIDVVLAQAPYISISPEQSNVFIQGEASNFTCVNPSPPGWIAVVIQITRPVYNNLALTYRNTGLCTGQTSNTTYVEGVMYWCDYSKFVLTVLNPKEQINKMQMRCGIGYGINYFTESFEIKVHVEIRTVTLTTHDTDSTIFIEAGQNQSITCTTDRGNPASWIRWYVDGRNVTDQAILQSPQQSGICVISSSILMYIALESDHLKNVYCEAMNIAGRPPIKSENKAIFILKQISRVTIMKIDENSTVNVVLGEEENLTCTTDAGRPAARIQWYFTNQNVTSQAVSKTEQLDDDTFISSSVLVYTGNRNDHGKQIHCEAINIEGRFPVISSAAKIYIKERPHKPYELTTFCTKTSSIVSWISNFDGSDSQRFVVKWMNLNTRETILSGPVFDEGEGKHHYAFTDSLDPATSYGIYVSSKNSIGVVNSSTINCTTFSEGIPLSSKEPISFGSGVVVGIIIAAFVGIVVVSLYWLMKRHRKKSCEKTVLYESTNAEVDPSPGKVYNEIEEINGDLNNQEMLKIGNPYEEVDTACHRNVGLPKTGETGHPRADPVKAAKTIEENTYDNLKV